MKFNVSDVCALHWIMMTQENITRISRVVRWIPRESIEIFLGGSREIPVHELQLYNVHDLCRCNE